MGWLSRQEPYVLLCQEAPEMVEKFAESRLYLRATVRSSNRLSWDLHYSHAPSL